MNKQLNFNNHRDKLTELDKQDLFELLSSGLRSKNRDLLFRRLNSHLNLIPHLGILERLIKDRHGWSYCAGQSYPEEIKAVRKIILECR